MKNQQKKWIAIMCATAVWFSFIANHSIQGAQIAPSLESGTAQSAVTVNNKIPDPITDIVPAGSSPLSGIAWGSIASIVGAMLIGYNLLTARSQGWGWSLFCAVGAVVTFVGRLGASLFCEISSDATGISDWDSD